MSVPGVTEIPGFYYDTVKRKYFKILSDHAVPSSTSSGGPSFYTPRKIADLEEAKKRKLEADAKRELPRSQYRPRHSILTSPYPRWTLEHELLVSSSTPVSRRAAYKKYMARQLVCGELMPAANVKQGVSNLFVERMGGTVYFIVGMDNGSITSFCANEVGALGLGLGGDIEGFKDRGFWRLEMERKMRRDGEVGERRLVKSDASVHNWGFRLPGMVTGTVVIENGESNLGVLVSSLSGVFARQHLTRTADFLPRTDGFGCAYSMGTFPSDQRPTLSMAHSPNKRTIFYGLEKGVAFGRADGQVGNRGAITNLRTDIFATYSLPPDAPSHTGFLAGGRDGTVRLFDVRANPRTCAPIMLNVGSVRHIGGLGGTGLVIRCVDSCARYDLRMSQRNGGPGSRSYPASVFRVPDGDGRKGGFDVYHEMGLVAIEGGGIGTRHGGSGGNEKAVYLFDVDCSDLVAKFPPGQVKFLKPEGGDGWPAVVVAGEHGVVVYE